MVTFKRPLPYGPGHLDCAMLQAVRERIGAQSRGKDLKDGSSEKLTEQLNSLTRFHMQSILT